MANSLVQFRVEENLKLEATSIFERLGIDLSTALRMFLARAVLDQGIPFPMKLDGDPKARNAMYALKEASRIAGENGISDMTLEEINSEIAEARKRYVLKE